jgi:hypothetical protein
MFGRSPHPAVSRLRASLGRSSPHESDESLLQISYSRSAGEMATDYVARPFVASAGTVPVQHLPRLPPEEAHGVTLVALHRQPLVSSRVPELVGRGSRIDASVRSQLRWKLSRTRFVTPPFVRVRDVSVECS